jgi:endoribonuclease Nob1
MATTYVLDTSAFIYGMMPGGEMETVPAVYGEVKDEQSRIKLELMEGLMVIEPDALFVARVAEAARASGDDKRISKADGDLLALALQEKEAGKDVALLTDDYAVQNVARVLGIRVIALRQKKSRTRVVWEKQCTGCRRSFTDGETCPVCGSPLRMRKRPITRGK